MSKPPPTHTAFALKRETRTRFRYLEIGEAELQVDGRNGSHRIYLDRLPVGGFGGYILLHPRGSRPPEPISEPETRAEDDP